MIEAINKTSTITCPKCGYSKLELMSDNSCQFFYECENCHALLKPEEGDCCVYCSYGTEPCPSVQIQKKTTGQKVRMEKYIRRALLLSMITIF